MSIDLLVWTLRNSLDDVIIFASAVKHNFKTPKKDIFNLSTVISSLLTFEVLPHSSFFFKVIFFLFEELFFRLLFRVSWLGTNPLNILYLKCLHFSFIPEGCFHWLENSRLAAFFFRTWKIFHFCGFWWKIHCYLNCCSHKRNASFSLAFHHFHLSLLFRSLILICLGMDFFWFMLFEIL